MAKSSASRKKSQVIEVDEDGNVTPATETTNLPAVHNGHGFDAPEGTEVKVKRQVTLQLLQWPDNKTIVCQIVGPIHEGKEIKGERGGKAMMGKAHLANIKSVQGELRQIIVSAVLRGIFEEEYPAEGYLNKWFRMTRHAPKEGKSYPTFTVFEIEDPS